MTAGPGRSPGPAVRGGPHAVLAYLIRRLFAAAVMLVVIILVVFCIFFLVPKWAGVDIALNYVGKQAAPTPSRPCGRS